MKEKAEAEKWEILKVCTTCGEKKLLTEFYKSNTCKFGRYTICKKCKAIENKKYREDHKQEIAKYRKENYVKSHDKILEQKKKYRRTEGGRLRQAHARQRRRTREKVAKVDLTVDQWNHILKNQHYKCNLCGKHFTIKRPATIDHIIPLSKGENLTSLNAQGLCSHCNRSKYNKLDMRYITLWAVLGWMIIMCLNYVYFPSVFHFLDRYNNNNNNNNNL